MIVARGASSEVELLAMDAEFTALLARPNKRSEAIANRIKARVRYQEIKVESIARTLMKTT